MHYTLNRFIYLLVLIIFSSCSRQKLPGDQKIQGSWRLLTSTTITKGKAELTDYTKTQQFVKIIGSSHFAFLNHDLHPKKDFSNHFDAGGGRYTIQGNQYTEYLDFYADKNWEGKAFHFIISFNGDTLIQTGVEKVEAEKIDRTIIERYMKIK